MFGRVDFSNHLTRFPNPESPTMQPLFQIGNDLLRLNDLIDERDGNVSEPEVEAALNQWLLELTGNEAVKLDGYVYLIKQLTSEAEMLQHEAQEYAAKAKSRTNRADWLKRRLKMHLEATGRTKIGTAKGHTVYTQTNGGQKPVTINDDMYSPHEVPEKFVKIKKEFDVNAIRKALEADDSDLPVGLASLGEVGTHLRIK